MPVADDSNRSRFGAPPSLLTPPLPWHIVEAPSSLRRPEMVLPFTATDLEDGEHVRSEWWCSTGAGRAPGKAGQRRVLKSAPDQVIRQPEKLLIGSNLCKFEIIVRSSIAPVNQFMGRCVSGGVDMRRPIFQLEFPTHPLTRRAGDGLFHGSIIQPRPAGHHAVEENTKGKFVPHRLTIEDRPCRTSLYFHALERAHAQEPGAP